MFSLNPKSESCLNTSETLASFIEKLFDNSVMLFDKIVLLDISVSTSPDIEGAPLAKLAVFTV